MNKINDKTVIGKIAFLENEILELKSQLEKLKDKVWRLETGQNERKSQTDENATRLGNGRYYYKGFILSKHYLPNYQFAGFWKASEEKACERFTARTKTELMKIIDEDTAGKEKGEEK